MRIRRIIKQEPLPKDSEVLINTNFGVQCARIWFGVVLNIAIEMLLGTSFFDHFIQGIFLSEQKVVPWKFYPVAILTSFKYAKS